jgi:hypothetical protein
MGRYIYALRVWMVVSEVQRSRDVMNRGKGMSIKTARFVPPVNGGTHAECIRSTLLAELDFCSPQGMAQVKC